MARGGFEQSCRGQNVAPGVELEARAEARSDTGLTREMEDAVDRSDQYVEVTRLEIEIEHVEASSILALPIRIVVVRERINRNDIISSRTKRLG